VYSPDHLFAHVPLQAKKQWFGTIYHSCAFLNRSLSSLSSLSSSVEFVLQLECS